MENKSVEEIKVVKIPLEQLLDDYQSVKDLIIDSIDERRFLIEII